MANVNMVGKDLQTPLHLAADRGFPAGCARLLQSSASVDLEDCAGLTPLRVAANRKHGECMRILFSAGAELVPKAMKAFDAWLSQQSVILHGLTAVELNGTCGVIAGRGDTGRIGVDIEGTGKKSIKPSNIVLLDQTAFLGDRILLRDVGDEKLAGKAGRLMQVGECGQRTVRVDGTDGLVSVGAQSLAPFLGHCDDPQVP